MITIVAMKNEIVIHPEVKALIFDIDGTIADTMPNHFKAFRKVLGSYDIDFTVDLFNRFAGVPILPQMNYLKEKYNPNNFVPEIVAVQKETEYRKSLSSAKPIQPILDVFLAHVGIFPIGCGTGGDRVVATKTLEVLGVLDKVDALITCDDVENGKPAPDTFLKCAELLGVEPQYCQVFEDGQAGIDAAIAAGMHVTDVRKYI